MINKYAVLILGILFIALAACSKQGVTRVSDDKADEVTIEWTNKDTRLTIEDLMKEINDSEELKMYQQELGRRPKLFIGKIQGNTSNNTYIDVENFNENLLSALARQGNFILLDASRRDNLIDEIMYQNSGMVDERQAKEIGKQSGTDAGIFGSIRMRVHGDYNYGNRINEYSVNLRIIELETGDIKFASSYNIQKSSEGLKMERRTATQGEFKSPSVVLVTIGRRPPQRQILWQPLPPHGGVRIYGGVYGPPQPTHGSGVRVHSPQKPTHGGVRVHSPQKPTHGGVRVHGAKQPSYGGVYGVYGPPQPTHGSGVRVHGAQQPSYGGVYGVYGPTQPTHGGGVRVHSPQKPTHGGAKQPSYGGRVYGSQTPVSSVDARTHNSQPSSQPKSAPRVKYKKNDKDKENEKKEKKRFYR